MESLLMMGPATQYTASWSPLSLSHHKVVSSKEDSVQTLWGAVTKNNFLKCYKHLVATVLASTLVTNTRIRDAVSGFWRFFFFFNVVPDLGNCGRWKHLKSIIIFLQGMKQNFLKSLCNTTTTSSMHLLTLVANFQIVRRIKDQGESRQVGHLPILRFYQR